MERVFCKLFHFVVFTILIISCNKEEITLEPKPVAGEYTLPLIETSDIHGHIVNSEGNTLHYRMAYIADKVKDIRGHGTGYKKERLLLLDGGDLYQGATLSILQKGKPVYIAMDKMGYDAVALGNHDFDWGVEEMTDPDATLPEYEYGGRLHPNDVPIVCANLYQNGSRSSLTNDYVIVEKTAAGPNGTVKVKIGIVGFAVDYSTSIIASQFSGKGYSIQENYTIANSIAEELESTGRCDATILLIHGEAERAAQRLGDSTAFDLVLGGHTHIATAGHTDWGLAYGQAGKRAEDYAYAELKFNVDEAGTIAFSAVGSQQLLSVDTTRDKRTFAGQNADDLDEEILTLSDSAFAAVTDECNEVIGYITVGANAYTIDGSGERAAVISNWMCDIMRRIGEADVAFVNSGGICTYFPLNGLPSRDITVANVYDMFPYGNHIHVYEITYAELLQIFEYSMTSSGKSLFSRVTGIDCHFSQSEEHTNASGSTHREYAVHSLVKDGTAIYQNNTWAPGWATRRLTIAVSDYVATTNREDYYTHLSNPLVGWSETSRLIINNLVDNVRVLKAEAAANNGHLYIDTSPHFILHNDD